ncbi:MAG: hypothetical protein OJI67_18655 [Prosthecobacter sp.]|nr:hypothetical protein [Prosthecobacter sp.]
MTQKTLTKAELSQFTSTEQWYRDSLNRNVVYTEGAKYVADCGRAYWLLDEIGFSQGIRKIGVQPFQTWKLKVHPDRSAMLTCEDGDSNVVHSKAIELTDFPLDEITLYFAKGVIMLPRETWAGFLEASNATTGRGSGLNLHRAASLWISLFAIRKIQLQCVTGAPTSGLILD